MQRLCGAGEFDDCGERGRRRGEVREVEEMMSSTPCFGWRGVWGWANGLAA